jgi:hypothetical protein
METRYFGRWDTYEQMRADWFDQYKYDYESGETRPEQPPADFPTDEQILFASYYDGDAFVLFERDGALYENTGSHCSCYELEGMWAPEKTTYAALQMRKLAENAGDYSYGWLSDHEQAAIDAMRALLPTLAEREVGEPAS